MGKWAEMTENDKMYQKCNIAMEYLQNYEYI